MKLSRVNVKGQRIQLVALYVKGLNNYSTYVLLIILANSSGMTCAMPGIRITTANID